MKNVLVLLPIQDRADYQEKLKAAGAGCSFTFAARDTITAEKVQAADIIIGNPAPKLIAGSERLELLQLESAGADAYVGKGILNEKTMLTNATGAYSPSVAEYAFAVTLMLQKKLYIYRDNQQKAVWGDEGMVTSLADSTVCVVGLGDIGCYYAKLVKAMGAKVIGVKRRPSECPEFVDELCLTENLKDVLPKADVIMSVLPGTKATTHFYTDEYFDLMKDSAVFINCGRGNAVATDVLYRAMTEKKIAAAAIDVAETEPLPADSPLWGLENLMITPHIYGGYHLPVTLERIVNIAAGNLSAWLTGQPLHNIVDFSTGYKK